MQWLLIIADTLSNIDIDVELTIFLCSSIAFLILKSSRNRHLNKRGKTFKNIELNANQGPSPECDTETHDEKHYGEVGKALRTAFEAEDYWQVLECWNKLKHFHQSSIYLLTIIRAMRSVRKGAYYTVVELRTFFKSHPQEVSIGLINDILESLSRSHEDSLLCNFVIQKLMPSISLAKDSRTYEILLTMHAARHDIEKAQNIVAEMKRKGIALTTRATVAIMTMGLQMGNIDGVLSTFVKLKASWDVRGTWAVSMFALEQHKANILMQIVTLACQKHKVSELSAALHGMSVPEEVLDTLEAKFSLLSEDELTSIIAELEKSGKNRKHDVIYNMLAVCLNSHSKAKSLSSVPQKLRAHSDSSTSAGSRSDSEEESNFGACFRQPPGLAPPPGF